MPINFFITIFVAVLWLLDLKMFPRINKIVMKDSQDKENILPLLFFSTVP